jgi:3D (Asp-Asp-Asp) domain-containing protein
MRYLLPSALALSLIGCAAPKKQPAKDAHAGRRMTVRTTAYTHTEAGGKNNAIGGRLHFGGKDFSAASDWSWIPLGTRFKMVSNGREYVIEDYGSALVGRQTIDLYFPDRGSLRTWGVRQEEIEILEWGSEAMSLKMLAPRCRNDHVATMVTQLRKQGVVPQS